MAGAKQPAPARIVRRAESTDDFIRRFYSDTFRLVEESISAGKANIYTGYQGMLLLADMLHGGAYAAPVNQRPYFMAIPEMSPYYAGPLVNDSQGGGLAGIFASLGSGQNASDLFKQLLMNANVPHVLPKLISDEAYGQFMILHAQAGTNFVVQGAVTGLKTLVESGKEMFGDEFGTRGLREGARLSREALAFLRANLGITATVDDTLGG